MAQNEKTTEQKTTQREEDNRLRVGMDFLTKDKEFAQELQLIVRVFSSFSLQGAGRVKEKIVRLGVAEIKKDPKMKKAYEMLKTLNM